MTDRQKAALNESLSTFGQVLEVIVRPHPTESGVYEILDGEHRFLSGEDPTSEVVVTVVEGISEAQARKMTIILNETRGRADDLSLASLLKELQEFPEISSIEDLQLGLPWERIDLEYMLDLVQPHPVLRTLEESEEETSVDDGDTVNLGPVRFAIEMPQNEYDRARELYLDLPDQKGEAPAEKWGRLLAILVSAAQEPEEEESSS